MRIIPSRPPSTAVIVLAAVLGACCLVKLLDCLFRHSVAILAGGVIMLLIIRTLHNLTK